ncbi:acid phosphatase type 7 isoform X4 [Nematostella vectensis]|uniref:acid phosphatase type 7 isoform X4 n=1 Tax=Nematostella vectensis TaxID=45351 RepID=UPI002077245C|nr:acid phosphatase type 7 isoform X4 [Nematostella vectensis]
MGHRPMYCSNTDHDDCTMHESRVWTGIPELNKPGLEDILYKYGADVLIWAHEHSYEKLFPVYNRQKMVVDSTWLIKDRHESYFKAHH